jgi:hypothetical protein
MQNLSMALDVLQINDQRVSQSDITEAKLLLQQTRVDQVSSIIRDWLKAPDTAVNHNSAYAKGHTGTGMWFIEGKNFQNWQSGGNSFLWLNGFAGCGKSVLCSIAIQHAMRQSCNNPADVGIAFFYFAFNDESKQCASGMLRALVLQLSEQHQECHTYLSQLHRTHQSSSPPNEVLLEYLQDMIRRFDQVYVFLDALDESARTKEREAVLETVTTMRAWGIPGLHLLVTSRDELDIRRSLSLGSHQDISLRNDGVQSDLERYISDKLRTSPNLRRWERYHDQIKQALLKQAQGV